MPTKPMIIKAKFPTFNKQNEEVKSLVNFFMENASMFFHGEYDENNKLDSYIGEIRFNNRPFSTYSPYELAIPYHIYFDADFPSFPSLPVSDVSSYSSSLPFINNTPIPIYDGVLDLELDSLSVVKTAMNLYCGSLSQGDEVETFVSTNTITLPVEITPVVDDQPNTNIRLKPKQIALHHTNADNLYLQKIPVESIFDENGNPIEDGFVYDFQLKTSSFKLEDTSKATPVFEEVYYKIGLCVIDPSANIDVIVSSLKDTTSLYLKTLSPEQTKKYTSFKLVQTESHSSSPDYKFYLEENTIEQHIGTGNVNGIANSCILMLQNSSSTNVAILYMKLYDSSGVAYTGVIDHINYELQDLEDNSGDNLYLEFSDQM